MQNVLYSDVKIDLCIDKRYSQKYLYNIGSVLLYTLLAEVPDVARKIAQYFMHEILGNDVLMVA